MGLADNFLFKRPFQLCFNSKTFWGDSEMRVLNLIEQRNVTEVSIKEAKRQIPQNLRSTNG